MTKKGPGQEIEKVLSVLGVAPRLGSVQVWVLVPVTPPTV